MGRTSPIGLEGSELTVSCPFTGVATTCGGSLSGAGAIAQPAVASAQLATIATPMAKRQYCLTGQGPRCVVAMNVVAPDSTLHSCACDGVMQATLLGLATGVESRRPSRA